ncbi:non-ribosomal peptide synthetase [Pelomyxa schiedti]|nr:non-ribosomal peptide synthetase [Pelomyxa schiedti]
MLHQYTNQRIVLPERNTDAPTRRRQSPLVLLSQDPLLKAVLEYIDSHSFSCRLPRARCISPSNSRTKAFDDTITAGKFCELIRRWLSKNYTEAGDNSQRETLRRRLEGHETGSLIVLVCLLVPQAEGSYAVSFAAIMPIHYSEFYCNACMKIPGSLAIIRPIESVVRQLWLLSEYEGHLSFGNRSAQNTAVVPSHPSGDFTWFPALAFFSAEHPSVPRFPFTSTEERHIVLHEWSGSLRTCSPLQFLHQMFEAQVHSQPHSDALAFGKDESCPRWTYMQVDKYAEQISNHLRTMGVHRNTVVGVNIENSAEYIFAFLGILKAGGAFMPLSSRWPQDRIQTIINTAQCSIIICSSNTPSFYTLLGCSLVYLPLASDLVPLAPTCYDIPCGHDLAYVICTSGSTGTPKLVGVTHMGAANVVECLANGHDYCHSRVVQAYSTVFDSSVAAIFSVLSFGGFLVIPPADVNMDVKLLESMLIVHRITHTSFVPSVLSEFCQQCKFPDTVCLVEVGGETLTHHHLKKIAAASNPARLDKIIVSNSYGPTEVTIACTEYRGTLLQLLQSPATEVPIGKPNYTHTCFVLDPGMNIVPVGFPGELWVGGPYLAQGYISNPEETAKQYRPNPFGEGRLYKTGDLVRWLPSGNMVFLGRVDSQVKLNGLRIELGEIESVARECPGVQEVVLAVRNSQLVCYVTSNRPGVASNLEKLFGTKLPQYMLPRHIIVLDHFPLTVNGKLDTKALPDPFSNNNAVLAAEEQPSSETEIKLAGIWEKVLPGRPGSLKFGKSSSFFAMGGHSLLAVSLARTISKEFNLDEFPVRLVFEHATLKDMASCIISLTEEKKTSYPRFSEPHAKLPHIVCLRGGMTVYFNRVRQELAKFADVEVPKYPEEIKSFEDCAEAVFQGLKNKAVDVLVGFCAGCFMAMALAKLLIASGNMPKVMIAIDPERNLDGDDGVNRDKTDFFSYYACSKSSVKQCYISLAKLLHISLGEGEDAQSFSVQDRMLAALTSLPEEQYIPTLLEATGDSMDNKDNLEAIFRSFCSVSRALVRYNPSKTAKVLAGRTILVYASDYSLEHVSWWDQYLVKENLSFPEIHHRAIVEYKKTTELLKECLESIQN